MINKLFQINIKKYFSFIKFYVLYLMFFLGLILLFSGQKFFLNKTVYNEKKIQLDKLNISINTMDILKEISISIITFKNVKKIHKFARIIAINTYGVFLFYYFPILLMYFILKYIKINKKLVLYFIQFYVLLYITLCAQKLSYSFIKYYLVSYLDFWNTFIQYISFMFFHGPIELLVHVIAIYILYNNIVINHKNTEIQTLIYLTLNKLCKLKFILFGLIVLAAFIEYNTSFDIKKIIF